MRPVAVAGLAFALAACGDGGGGELAAGNSQLTQAQIDAALGPADQSAVQDALLPDNALETNLTGDEAANNSAAAEDDGSDGVTSE